MPWKRTRLNGLGSPFGIETEQPFVPEPGMHWLNGLGSPFGIECAASHGWGSPMQWARTRRKVLGSPHSLDVERQRGQEHVRKAVTGENAVAMAEAARLA